MRPISHASRAFRRTRATRILRALASTLALVPAALHAQARWTLRETLRIGGAESGPEGFVAITSIAVDGRGRIFVLERRSQDIRVFGPNGAHLRTLGRLGSGPGEMRNAEGITFTRDGKLWVRDAANARFTIFNADGAYERSWTMRFCTSQGAWTPQLDDRGRILDVDCVIGEQRPLPYAILGYREDLSRVDTIAPRPECGSRELSEASTWVRRSARAMMFTAVPFAPFPIAALGPSGETWCAPHSGRYEILRISLDGRDTIRVARTVPSVPVTPRERDSIIASMETRGPTGLDYGRIPRSKPAIYRLSVDHQGRLWVRRQTAQGGVAFDLFNASGQFLATVEAGPQRMPAYLPFVVRGDTIYTVVLDEDDLQYVARFEIQRR